MRSIGNDIRYALRQLKKSTGFATVAILTLAIGIGATTAIFTLVYDVLLKPLPYSHPEQLVVLQEQVAEFKDIYPTLPMNANNFVNWQQHSKSFKAMVLMGPDNAPLGAGGHPLQVGILRATSGFFPVLAAAPQLGRAFTSQEDRPGSEHVVVLMHGLWEQGFHGDPKILGKTVALDGYPYTVIGVMPSSFHLPSGQTMQFGDGASNSMKPLEAIVPLALNQAQLKDAVGDFSYFGLARLKPGVSAMQANAEIDALQRGISARLPANEKATLSAALTPFQRYLVGNNTKALGILLAAVAGLLLIGCINIMNLLLARAVCRRQDMAVASALGATRADLLRVSIREAGVLAAIGGTLGILLATLAKPDPMIVYVPYWYRSETTAGLVVRTQQDPGMMADVIRKAVWSIDPAASVPEVRSLGGVVAGSVETRRFEMGLLLLFAISAWLLAGLGVYGVVSYSVVQRRQEIGLRMALGAQRTHIYTQVLREGLVPVLAGCLVGVAVAFGFANLMGSLLYEVSPFNPAIALLASACLIVAGVAACLLPARQASSVDPMQALRAE